jgi:hypothetical protein
MPFSYKDLQRKCVKAFCLTIIEYGTDNAKSGVVGKNVSGGGIPLKGKKSYEKSRKRRQ